MPVLIAYASARSSTAEIARQIADRLRKSGFTVAVRVAEQVESIQAYQSVIFGSDLHDKKRLLEASAFIARFSGELARAPLWLFSTSDDETDSLRPKIAAPACSKPHERAAVVSVSDKIGIRGHRHFAGTFERGDWSLLRDLFLKICGGRSDDGRDWREINAWAADIARELQRIDHGKERRRLHLSVRGRP